MFYMQQQESKLFQEKDALMMEWDFIECNVVDTRKEEEKCAKIVVKMENDTKIIYLPRSTLTLEYSISDLRKKIMQEFKISKEKTLRIFFDNKRIMITNDLALKHIIESLKDIPLEIEVCLTEVKHCILCMKSDCYHVSTNAQNAEKKRKTVECKIGVNLLNPKEREEDPTVNTKKRRIASCGNSQNNQNNNKNCNNLKSSHNLLLGSFIF